MDEASSGGMTVFPNPVTGNSFFIRTGSGPVSKDLPLRLYSINGQLLISKWIKKGQSGLIEIKLTSAIASGVYVVQLDDKHTVKVIIRK